MRAVAETRGELSCVEACAALGVPRASYYRRQADILRETQGSESENRPRKPSPRALSAAERARVLDVLHDERFRDLAVPQVFAALMDEGEYLCSMRSMYRILDDEGEVRERRNQRRHPNYSKPELLATGPNQVWSWDITKLRGPRKWTYSYLYVVLDIFSRYAVGWMVASRESAALGEKLVAEAVEKQKVEHGQLTLHSDRGSPMTAKSMALLLADLGVTKSHSRPHVSDDNPFSEAQFKTVKYRPGFPGRFGCLEDARSHMGAFFDWYHHEHRHSGLGWMTPADVHYGRAESIRARRAEVLETAYARHPERFVRRPPVPAPLPEAVWINKPVLATADAQ
jgi:putative transposase